MKIFFMVMLSVAMLSALNLRRDSKNGVVIDIHNKIVWQDSKVNVMKKMSQPQAQEYCQNLTHAGSQNWRLPSMKELALIVDKNNKVNFIHRAFKYNVPAGYWSENVKWRTMWFYADYMHFLSGTAYFDNKNTKKYVRCVKEF